MPVLGKRVTAKSSDKQIIDAINVAGELRHLWRRSDWPDRDENNTRSWVIPNDIGYSCRRDTSLLKRLKAMVKQGKLEMDRTGNRIVYTRGEFERVRHVRGMPRFRALSPP